MTADERENGSPAREESVQQRADRNLTELLQELRVSQAGVRIVFAFLLGIAFTPRFADLSSTQRDVYVAALLASVVSLAVLEAPVAIHRALFRRGMKERIVTLSARCARLGLLLVSVALDCVVFVVLDVVVGRVAAWGVTGGIAAVFAALWFAFPWVLRRW